MQRQWTPIKEYSDILFEYFEGIAKITINRPQVRNAFTPTTVAQMSEALVICRQRNDIRVVVLTGAGDKAFCSGGDMHVKGIGGYIDPTGVPRLNVLDVQKQIRSLPKPVIAMVNGFAIGGGHVLQVVCDLSIASENAVFGQTGPRVGSFDAGFGASYLARCVGQKKAREIWFMCRKYSAQEALEMGLINKVVPFDQLEDEVVDWAKTIMNHSALAIRMIKAGLNAELDGQAGIQELAGDATMLYYMTEEAQEGDQREAFTRRELLRGLLEGRLAETAQALERENAAAEAAEAQEAPEPREITEAYFNQVVDTALARDCGVANLTSWDEKEYFHYRPLLSASYARILSAKNNPAEMICDLVREHSRIYPRPVTIGTFQEEPFNLKPEELQELMQSFPKDPKKSDIKFTTSSLGTVFLYSNKYLEDDYADFLAQYLDVDQVMSP